MDAYRIKYSLIFGSPLHLPLTDPAPGFLVVFNLHGILLYSINTFALSIQAFMPGHESLIAVYTNPENHISTVQDNYKGI